MVTPKSSLDDKKDTVELTFRSKFILLPLAILLLTTILTFIFYPQLTDSVAYRFNLNGSPESWMDQQGILLLALLPQIILFIMAVVMTWGTIRAGRSVGQIASALKPERLLMLMGNIMALPQIIFGFVILDVLIYNIYDNHLMPVWLFALIIMIVGGIILTLFFIQSFKRSRNINL